MITSDHKIKELVETYSQKAKDTKPIGVYTKKEIIKLEHEWRLKLKSSGFSDIEMWDNKPKETSKRIKFIKGHIRKCTYQKYSEHVTLMDNGQKIYQSAGLNAEVVKFWKGYKLHGTETFEYYRLIGLFAHHAPSELLPVKYKKLLQSYAAQGTYSEAIRTVAPKIKSSAVEMFVRRNIQKIITFVNTLENEDDQRTRHN